MTAVDPVSADAGLLAPGWAGSPASAETSDAAYLRALLDAEAALTRAQASLGLALAEAAAAVSDAAGGAGFDVASIALRARSGGNPVIPLVADLTAAVTAEHGPYVHRGATSQDILDSATMLVAARTLDVLLGDLDRAERALARLAREHRDTVLPGRTLTQHAVPTTFGLKAAGWRSLVLDARDRVRTVRSSLPAQLGGAAGTLAAFTVFGADDTRELTVAYARELGLAEPVLPWHTLRTPVADLAARSPSRRARWARRPSTSSPCPARRSANWPRARGRLVRDAAQGEPGARHPRHRGGPPGTAARGHAVRRADRRGRTPGRGLARRVGAAARPAPAGRRRRGAGGRTHRRAARGRGGDARTPGPHARVDRLRTAGRRTRPLLGRSRAKALLTRAAERAVSERRPLADVLGEEPDLADLTASDLADLTDPTRYTGSAGALTDRALERR